MFPRLLTAPEAAKLLRLPLKSLYQAAQEGRVPVVRVGKRGVRFSEQQLEAWVARGGFQQRNEGGR